MNSRRMATAVMAVGLLSALTVPVRAQTQDSKIAYLGTDETSNLEDVFVVNPDGTEVTNLSATPEQNEYEPAWSPDGTRIALMARPAEGVDWKIKVLDANTGEMSGPILPDFDGFQGSPTWSPSGKRLAFVFVPVRGPAVIVISRPDGSRAKVLPRLRVSPYYLDWGPNGRIVFNASDENEASDLYTIRTDGRGLKRLTRTPNHTEWTPTWSPDGKRIAFAGSNGLFVGRSDGTRFREVVGPGGYPDMPSWSPDGKSITYSTYVWVEGTPILADCDVVKIDLETNEITAVAATPHKCEWDSDWQS